MIEALKWQPLFVMSLQVGYPRAQVIGTTAVGGRGVYPVDGGTFEGPRLRGVVNPGGADWVTLRTDDVMMIDVRLSLRTHDEAVIGMSYTGLARAADPSVMDRFRKRELMPYEDVYLRNTPRFESGDPRYAWLNGIVAVANGKRIEGGGVYHVFAID
jgi:hypothetical protein